MLLFRILFLATFLFPLAGNAGAEDFESAQKVLEMMTLTYSQVDYMKSNFKKTSRSTLLGIEEKAKGSLEYSKNKYRLETFGKEGTLFIKGQKEFWYVSGHEVMTGLSGKAVPSVFDAIFSDPKIWSKFKSSYVSVPDDLAVVKVDTAGKMPNIVEMTLTIDLKKRTLKKMNYIDDVNNSVDIDFKSTRFFSKPRPKRFRYKIKKSDNVSKI